MCIDSPYISQNPTYDKYLKVNDRIKWKEFEGTVVTLHHQDKGRKNHLKTEIRIGNTIYQVDERELTKI